MGGLVECWGSSDYGALGDGGLANNGYTPVIVTGIAGATQISVGSHGACAVVAGGQIKCWGKNNKGQLGNGTTSNTATPTPVSVTGIVGATEVSAASSGEHTCALVADGQIRCWGAGVQGQLGNGSIGNNVHSSTPVSVVI